MNREYHKWWSPRLGRDMELLVFGHAGLPTIVFPTSQGRFFEFEDRGMVGALWQKIESGGLQLFCLDSVDAESWYNKNVPPRWRIARHTQYEDYVLHEVVPLIRQKNSRWDLATAGCSFGGYHAMNLALRRPDKVKGCVSMGGAFDITQFLDGYYDNDCYLNC
ncbi:MAG TPA: alpha/beta fold hydrolase, partial [Terriglobales bacterium]|nr:alpha/beta fold hydrolase [Terriglobales bacterium]